MYVMALLSIQSGSAVVLFFSHQISLQNCNWGPLNRGVKHKCCMKHLQLSTNISLWVGNDMICKCLLCYYEYYVTVNTNKKSRLICQTVSLSMTCFHSLLIVWSSELLSTKKELFLGLPKLTINLPINRKKFLTIKFIFDD